ncbi:Lrp/AsnC family transcriptional regulator [Methylobacter sp. BBA5.1]|uniref:Lrp/AsnC family transcriptional regulator n=1 Tax=Methylobacter sp. BBA5.1 TaxID=1495064 RepID=UPI000560436A|nr:AsnC family transcriptional regulator [Methylobacter sp. BBA5.1]
MDNLDRRIINALQGGFPICDAPYRQVALTLNITEAELLIRLKNLRANGILTRFGPLYNAEQMGGALTLAAVKAPERFDEIADIINAFPEVAHNYARRHTLNMWFVIATETPEQVSQTIDAIEEKTGLTVYNMPKIKEYFVNLKLEA